MSKFFKKKTQSSTLANGQGQESHGWQKSYQSSLEEVPLSRTYKNKIDIKKWMQNIFGWNSQTGFMCVNLFVRVDNNLISAVLPTSQHCHHFPGRENTIILSSRSSKKYRKKCARALPQGQCLCMHIAFMLLNVNNSVWQKKILLVSNHIMISGIWRKKYCSWWVGTTRKILFLTRKILFTKPSITSAPVCLLNFPVDFRCNPGNGRMHFCRPKRRAHSAAAGARFEGTKPTIATYFQVSA